MATFTLPYKPLTFLLFSLLVCSVHGQLSTTFYQKTCPNLLAIVRSAMTQVIAKDARMGGSLLRLFFHDCFVNGCDAGVLLDDTANFTGEKNAGPNANSLRGFEIIDSIKTQVEASCKATVSCADILALTARDSVNLLRGPFWDVPLGRRDARTASMSGANANLPGPGSSLSTLISMFAAQGLTANEMTVLSGAHTIGQARCTFFRNRIYNEKNINASFASTRQQTCPQSGGDNNLAPFDVQTPNQFDNWYFANLVKNKGLLHSDQELFNGGSQDSLVQQYSTNMALFAADFAKAMIKLGNINVLTGNTGEIRLNCRKTN